MPGRAPSRFFFTSRRRHTTSLRDWSSDVCSSDLQYRSSGVIDRVFDLARGVVEVSDSEAAEGELQMYERLASALIYTDPARRASPERSEERRVGKGCRAGAGADQ